MEKLMTQNAKLDARTRQQGNVRHVGPTLIGHFPVENPAVADIFQKQKSDNGKPTFDLLPFDALAEVSKVLEFGAQKYEVRGWENGMQWLRLANAAARHLFAWDAGEKADPETGLSHMAHLAANALFLLAYELRGVGIDDRR